DELPVVREPLGGREFERAVVAARRAEAGAELDAGQVLGRHVLTDAAAGVEEEVVVAVVKRAVLDDVVLRAVDAAEAEREVFDDLVLDAGRVLVNGLRRKTRVDRGRVAAEVA